uniref:SKP1 component POZ domain-containing protein n=1 Tax=Salix viminalis TaxID=40686 RepID=A0A6N2KU34_SALVM
MASSAETTIPSTETTIKTITESTKIVKLRTSDEEIFEVEESVAMEMALVNSFLKESPSAGTVPLLNTGCFLYVRVFLGIENYLIPEKEAKLREEHSWAFEDVDEDY